LILAAPLTLEDPEPTIAVTALADSAIELLCGAWTRTTDDLTAYRSLLADVSVRFDAAGITIPYSQRDLHLRLAGTQAVVCLPDPQSSAVSDLAP
jgi:small conductance mechanosensitive channel